MATNYDKIAWVYDILSSIVYGQYIVRAQRSLLKYVPAQSRILLVGGGTGWILEEMAKQHSSGLIIDYVESSDNMIALSKKKGCGTNVVNFMPKAIEDFSETGKYDVIFTPFVFDNFKPDKTARVFTALHSLLKNKGTWLYADFTYDEKEGKLWQKLLLKIMYLFFRITCNIETSEIENMDPYFENGYEKLYAGRFYAGFISSAAYQKR